jgi:hypothetical protein
VRPPRFGLGVGPAIGQSFAAWSPLALPGVKLWADTRSSTITESAGEVTTLADVRGSPSITFAAGHRPTRSAANAADAHDAIVCGTGSVGTCDLGAATIGDAAHWIVIVQRLLDRAVGAYQAAITLGDTQDAAYENRSIGTVAGYPWHGGAGLVDAERGFPAWEGRDLASESGVRLLVATWDPATDTATLYEDGATIAQIVGVGPFAVVGDTVSLNGQFYPGFVGQSQRAYALGVGYGTALTRTHIDLLSRWGLRNFPTTLARGRLLALDGSSIDLNLHTDLVANDAIVPLTLSWSFVNNSVSGQDIDHVDNLSASSVLWGTGTSASPHKSTAAIYTTFWLPSAQRVRTVVSCGTTATNTMFFLAQNGQSASTIATKTWTALTDFATRELATGGTHFAVVPSPRIDLDTSPHQAQWDAAYATIVAQLRADATKPIAQGGLGATALVDYPAGGLDDPSDTDLFLDGVHPTVLARQIQASLWAPALNALG